MGDIMGRKTDAEPTLAELIAARDNVRREIDILEGGPAYYGVDRDAQVGGLIRQLSNTLDELERCIAEWKPTDDPKS
jgi:hypothetical protein